MRVFFLVSLTALNTPLSIDLTAIICCQELTQFNLNEIAEYFDLCGAGSVSYVACQVRKRRREDKRFDSKVERIVDSIIRQVT